MPFAGNRYDFSAVNNQGTDARYWSSTRNNPYSAHYFHANSTVLGVYYDNYRAGGYTVRCFKNTDNVLMTIDRD